MAVIRRKRADQTTAVTLPRVPLVKPSDWPADLYDFLRDLMRVLEAQQTIILGIQDEGTAQPLRASINFVGAGVTVTDDATNDRLTVTIP